jgi:hypothetical protein
MAKSTVASNYAAIEALRAEVAAVKNSTVTEHEFIETIERMTEVFEGALKAIEDQLAALQTAPAPKAQAHRTTATRGKTLYPCNATPACSGHSAEKHVAMHVAQVAKRSAKA